jgi:hypothetical protein
MRYVMTLVVLSAMLWAGSFAQEHPASSAQSASLSKPVFSITIASSSPLNLSAPIKISVTVKNVSNTDMPWEAEYGNTAYKAFDVSLTRGNHSVATTFFHRKIRGKQRADDPHETAGGSSVVSMVTPGETFIQTIDLRRLYNITEPGMYTVQVSRYDEARKMVVHSNTLTLKIVP